MDSGATGSAAPNLADAEAEVYAVGIMPDEGQYAAAQIILDVMRTVEGRLATQLLEMESRLTQRIDRLESHVDRIDAKLARRDHARVEPDVRSASPLT